MKVALATTLAAVVALGGCAGRPAADANDVGRAPAPARGRPLAASPLVGAWHLAWLELPGPDGALRRVTDAKGALIYTPTGQVSVQVMYASAASAPSSGPVQYAAGGFEGSFGQYVVDTTTRTVTHRYDGANVRALLGQDVPRRYTFVDGRLIIRSTRPDEHWSVAWERY
ncbi:MAG TPA: lipocalin-like domain-containing protein [Gemmatirosa sp.]